MKNLKRSTERFIWALSLFVLIGIFYFVPKASSFRYSNSDITELNHYNKLLMAAYNSLRQFYVNGEKMDTKKLFYGAIHGMFKATGDAYTTLLEPKVYKNLKESIQGEFEGIGAYVGMKNNRVVIVSPIYGTPAYKAGLKPGDVIMKIEKKSTEGMKLHEAVSLLRGKRNTKVKIEVFRQGVPKFLKVSIVRKNIQIPSVKATLLKNRVGYIKITTFADNTPRDLEKSINKMRRKGMKKLVIDLRFNPGGALSAVVEMADMFLEGGLIVYTKGRHTQNTRKFFAGDEVAVDPDMPLVVLVNQGSASASEIFAGAMKDRKRATIIGHKTFGKGTVQNVIDVLDKDKVLGLKITTAKYYTPGGYVIAGKGIKPNIKVEMPKMTAEEEFHTIRLLKLKLIQKFAKRYRRSIPRSAFKSLQRTLKRKGLKIRDIFVKKLIRDEQSFYSGPKIVDLEYDSQLRKALEVLKRK